MSFNFKKNFFKIFNNIFFKNFIYWKIIILFSNVILLLALNIIIITKFTNQENIHLGINIASLINVSLIINNFEDSTLLQTTKTIFYNEKKQNSTNFISQATIINIYNKKGLKNNFVLFGVTFLVFWLIIKYKKIHTKYIFYLFIIFLSIIIKNFISNVFNNKFNILFYKTKQSYYILFYDLFSRLIIYISTIVCLWNFSNYKFLFFDFKWFIIILFLFLKIISQILKFYFLSFFLKKNNKKLKLYMKDKFTLSFEIFKEFWENLYYYISSPFVKIYYFFRNNIKKIIKFKLYSFIYFSKRIFNKINSIEENIFGKNKNLFFYNMFFLINFYFIILLYPLFFNITNLYLFFLFFSLFFFIKKIGFLLINNYGNNILFHDSNKFFRVSKKKIIFYNLKVSLTICALLFINFCLIYGSFTTINLLDIWKHTIKKPEFLKIDDEIMKYFIVFCSISICLQLFSYSKFYVSLLQKKYFLFTKKQFLLSVFSLIINFIFLAIIFKNIFFIKTLFTNIDKPLIGNIEKKYFYISINSLNMIILFYKSIWFNNIVNQWCVNRYKYFYLKDVIKKHLIWFFLLFIIITINVVMFIFVFVLKQSSDLIIEKLYYVVFWKIFFQSLTFLVFIIVEYFIIKLLYLIIFFKYLIHKMPIYLFIYKKLIKLKRKLILLFMFNKIK